MNRVTWEETNGYETTRIYRENAVRTAPRCLYLCHFHELDRSLWQCGRVHCGHPGQFSGLGDQLPAYKYQFKASELVLFEPFAIPDKSFEEKALAVIQMSLDRGAAPNQIMRAAILLQVYELMFWDAMSELSH